LDIRPTHLPGDRGGIPEIIELAWRIPVGRAQDHPIMREHEHLQYIASNTRQALHEFWALQLTDNLHRSSVLLQEFIAFPYNVWVVS
jgi:hypothetical protein